MDIKNLDSAEYPRMLSRSISYLHRQKIKFMNSKLKDFDIIGAMYIIMLAVARNPGTSQDAIVTDMNIDKCTVARRTRKLVDLGYIQKETNEADRRQNSLFLTEKGKTIIPIIRENLALWSETMSEGLTVEEERSLVVLLDKIVENYASNQ